MTKIFVMNISSHRGMEEKGGNQKEQGQKTMEDVKLLSSFFPYNPSEPLITGIVGGGKNLLHSFIIQICF